MWVMKTKEYPKRLIFTSKDFFVFAAFYILKLVFLLYQLKCVCIYGPKEDERTH